MLYYTSGVGCILESCHQLFISKSHIQKSFYCISKQNFWGEAAQRLGWKPETADLRLVYYFPLKYYTEENILIKKKVFPQKPELHCVINYQLPFLLVYSLAQESTSFSLSNSK